MAKQTTIFSDLLKALGVPHTASYSDAQFGAMPFNSAFGLSKLLERYGVASQGLQIGDKHEITKLTPPFLADTPEGFVIVTRVGADNVSYITQGQNETMPLADFLQAWNGMALLAFPDSHSREPGYAGHRTIELIDEAKRYVMWLGAAALFAYLFISGGLWRHVSYNFVALFDVLGIVLTYMLVQKSLNIHNSASDRVCGVLEAGGCDSILELKASKFFGIFSWSELGFAYFSVSLLCLLMFPQYIAYLAAYNVCCLPFTVWSIWYQKFRARHWCTLCVSVQSCLWLLFFSYLAGGSLTHVFPLRIQFWVLGVTYMVVLLALNRLLPSFDRKSTDYEHQDDTPTAA